jgi:two-component system chemotaxis response regulator CheB
VKSDLVKILVVDDSVIYRSQIKQALAEIEGVTIGGAASNGKIAIEKLSVEKFDLVTLDLEMPEMGGLEVLAEIRNLKIDVKVIVFSSFTKKGAQATVKALNAGACDFVTKIDSTESKKSPSVQIRELFEPKIKALFDSRFNPIEKVIPEPKPRISSISFELLRPKIIVIASSTGGPNTLEKIFKKIDQACECPIVIAQHMPPIFTETFAERLSKVSGLCVSEAKDGDILKNGHVYIAPGDFHVKLKKEADESVKVILDQSEKIHFVRPAADHLFQTAASIYKEKCLGIVLTGMGMDGASGCQHIRNSKGAVFIQEEESCVVYGMPRAAKEMGAFDKEVSLDEVSLFINERPL